jgi:hypothetical protein
MSPFEWIHCLHAHMCRCESSPGRAKSLRQTDADTGVLKRTRCSNIEQEEEGKDVTEDARIKSAERQDRKKETSPSSFAPAPAAVKAVVSQEAGQAAFKSMHAAPDATAPGPVGEAFRAVSSGASDAANHLTREEQAIQAASRVRASLNKRESPQQLLVSALQHCLVPARCFNPLTRFVALLTGCSNQQPA